MKDAALRWFIIGKERLDSEINLEKVLKTLRNMKILTLNDKSTKAHLNLDQANVIELDSDCIERGREVRRMKQAL